MKYMIFIKLLVMKQMIFIKLFVEIGNGPVEKVKKNKKININIRDPRIYLTNR